MSPRPDISEAALTEADERIPALAAQAGRAAHERALAERGKVVMKSARGMLVELDRNGVTHVLKALPPETPVVAGTVLTRKRKPTV